MALKPCPECKTEISTSAAACPKCGAPQHQPKKTSGCAITAAVFVGFVILIAALFSMTQQNEPKRPAPAAPAVDRSTVTQQKRERLLGDLQASGVFGKYQCRDNAGTVWVKPGFYVLPFDDKQSFVSVVYAYCIGGDTSGFIILKDDRSGKEAGTYWGNRGLVME